MHSECGGRITFSNLEIKYPNAGYYKSSEDCTWNIDAGVPIYIRFTKFKLEHEAKCVYDYVKTTDNGMSRKYCGNKLPPSWRSANGKITFTFRSDRGVNGAGFVALIGRLLICIYSS